MPVDIPETTPPELIVATDVALLVQVPPVAELASRVVPPVHNARLPVTGGVEITVTKVVAMQPVLNVYETATVPGVIPETVPDAFTVATERSPLVHVPLVPMLASVVVNPVQVLPMPVLGESGFTVVVLFVLQPVGNV